MLAFSVITLTSSEDCDFIRTMMKEADQLKLQTAEYSPPNNVDDTIYGEGMTDDENEWGNELTGNTEIHSRTKINEHGQSETCYNEQCDLSKFNRTVLDRKIK